VIFQIISLIYITAVSCPLSMQTQGCISLALQHCLNANFTNVEIADVWLLSCYLWWHRDVSCLA